VLFFLLGAACWTLWLNKNDYIFNQKLISSPRAIFFRIITFLQLWMILSTGDAGWVGTAN
jgi:hypothetical protein